MMSLKRASCIAVCIIITGCSGYQYVAGPPYVPLHAKKGELQGNVYPSGVQIGYSSTDHFGLFATGYKRFPTLEKVNPFYKENSGRYERSGEAQEFNAGTTFFRKKDRFVYELLAGAGAGVVDYEIHKDMTSDYDFKMKARIRNLYIYNPILE